MYDKIQKNVDTLNYSRKVSGRCEKRLKIKTAFRNIIIMKVYFCQYTNYKVS